MRNQLICHREHLVRAEVSFCDEVIADAVLHKGNLLIEDRFSLTATVADEEVRIAFFSRSDIRIEMIFIGRWQEEVLICVVVDSYALKYPLLARRATSGINRVEGHGEVDFTSRSILIATTDVLPAVDSTAVCIFTAHIDEISPLQYVDTTQCFRECRHRHRARALNFLLCCTHLIDGVQLDESR